MLSLNSRDVEMTSVDVLHRIDEVKMLKLSNGSDTWFTIPSTSHGTAGSVSQRSPSRPMNMAEAFEIVIPASP